MKEIKLCITNNTLVEYEDYYFSIHPKAHKKPITTPYHTPLNQWMIMKRPMMNSLKQKWKDFIIWFIQNQGYSNLQIHKCEMTFSTYFKTNRRHDVDGTIPKFILDGFVDSGFIYDDDMRCLTKLILRCNIDKENPRTEITIKILEE